jgi:Tfp pilus assembly protein PilN
MRAVNLLPDERQGEATGPGRFLTTTWLLAAGAAMLAIVCVLIAVSYLNAKSDVSKKQEELTAVQQQVEASRQQQAAQTTQTTPVVDETQARLAAFNAAATARIPWDTLLSDVSRALPSGSWLSSLSLTAPAPPTTSTDASGVVTTTASGTGFTVSGYAISNQVIARVMQRLALVPMLQNITLQSSARTDFGLHSVYQFTMNASVLVTGAS